ncbi:MAG: glycosyltransferase [Bacteroidetes bacterium]|nr:glycosyltransferase [Bacteroidota bacterium]
MPWPYMVPTGTNIVNTEWLIILISTTGSIYCLLQLVIFTGWMKHSDSEDKEEDSAEKFLSVIIAAHNEIKNLKRFLPHLLTQNYKNYEIILVLDRCEDENETWLQQQNDSRIRLVVIEQTPEGWAPKKWAVSQGIHAAHSELLVFTDADCQVGKNWLKTINKAFSEEKSLILGLSPYFQETGLLNAFIQYETFYTAFQFVGLTELGLPYMGLGRNMAYRKSFFLENNGFKAFKTSLSGDDDLMVNAYADPRKTGIVLERENWVFSEPKKIFRDWIRQKWRHVSASGHYTFRSKLILGIFHASHLLFYLLTLTGWIWSNSPEWIVFLYIGKTLLSWGLFQIIVRKYQLGDFNYPWPFLDFLFFLYNLSIVPIGLIRKPTWI